MIFRGVHVFSGCVTATPLQFVACKKKRGERLCVNRLSSLLVRYEKLFLFDKRNKPKENYGANSGGNDLADKLFAPLDT